MTQTTLPSEDSKDERVLYMALELSNTKWQVVFGDGSKRRRVTVEAGDLAALSEAIEQAKQRLGLPSEVPIRSCYEAGRDGFWLHRWLVSVGIENQVVDSASIEVKRRKRRVKTDRVDAQKLLSMLMRYHGGEHEVWSVVQVPDEEAEDGRRLHRELERLKKERTGHRNRLRSLLVAQGIRIEPNGQFLKALAEARLWDGSPLGGDLRGELLREYDRLRLVEGQIRALEAEQRERLAEADTEALQQIEQLSGLCGIGVTSAWVFVMEFFGWREFNNRREVAALAGLTGTPYDSGDSQREQGISKAGNGRIRALIVEIGWSWLRYQPASALSRWFEERFAHGGKRQRRIGIVALARRLLIALWRYLDQGVLPEGAQLKAA